VALGRHYNSGLCAGSLTEIFGVVSPVDNWSGSVVAFQNALVNNGIMTPYNDVVTQQSVMAPQWTPWGLRLAVAICWLGCSLGVGLVSGCVLFVLFSVAAETASQSRSVLVSVSLLLASSSSSVLLRRDSHLAVAVLVCLPTSLVVIHVVWVGFSPPIDVGTSYDLNHVLWDWYRVFAGILCGY
jgi:hypothetical protein